MHRQVYNTRRGDRIKRFGRGSDATVFHLDSSGRGQPLQRASAAAGTRSSSHGFPGAVPARAGSLLLVERSEEHTSELQSLRHLVCRLLLEKKKTTRVCTISVPPPLACDGARNLGWVE